MQEAGNFQGCNKSGMAENVLAKYVKCDRLYCQTSTLKY